MRFGCVLSIVSVGTALLTRASYGETSGQGDSKNRCAIVQAVLKAKFDSGKREYFAPASEQKCALVNGYKDGIVLVHPILGNSRDSKQPSLEFIQPGIHCGPEVLVVSADWLRSRAHRKTNVVTVTLRQIDERTHEFFEHVEIFDPAEPSRQDTLVSVGTSCAPEWGGEVRYESGVWTARIH